MHRKECHKILLIVAGEDHFPTIVQIIICRTSTCYALRAAMPVIKRKRVNTSSGMVALNFSPPQCLDGIRRCEMGGRSKVKTSLNRTWTKKTGVLAFVDHVFVAFYPAGASTPLNGC